MTLKLAIFDVDGTLVDSQAQIFAAMRGAFLANGFEAPDSAAVRSIIGLSLPSAIWTLLPNTDRNQVDKVVHHYKEAYAAQRVRGGERSPLYPGVMDTLQTLANREDTLLAIATGKSQRGLDHVLEMHDLRHFFVTFQVADHHPSKPHPSMVLTALSDTGVEASNAVMIGDTSFDMKMGKSAGVATLGVTWGYHSAAELQHAGASTIVSDYSDVVAELDCLWGAR